MLYAFPAVFTGAWLTLAAVIAWRRDDRDQFLKVRNVPAIIGGILFLIGFFGNSVTILRVIGGAGILLGALSVFRFSAPVAAIAIGIVMNLSVVLANGRMPVLDMRVGATKHHIPLSESTLLPWFADLFTTHSDKMISSFSIGDALLAIGLWWMVARIATLPRLY